MSDLVTITRGQMKQAEEDAAAAARAEVFNQINTILDRYDATDGENMVGECAPEDRWRLYRDLYALTGRADPDTA